VIKLKFTANGLTLNCIDYGGAGHAPLLFLHGGSAHAHWWDLVAPAFVDRFHALALDLRGHGESEWTTEWEYGTRHYTSDLDQIISNWGLGAPILVGHSMGGHTVLAYACEHADRLRAMVAIDAPQTYSELAVNFLRGVGERPVRRFDSLEQALANFRLMPRETIASKELLEEVGRKSFKQLADGFWTHKFDRRTLIRDPIDVSSHVAQITCPALLVKLSNSHVLDHETARKMIAALPNGRLTEVPESYHHVMFDNPAGLIAVLKAFLAELPLG